MQPTEFHSHHTTTGVRSAVVDMASGDTTVVVAAPGANQAIRVHGWNLSSPGAATLVMQDSAANTARTGTIRFANGTPNVQPFSPVGIFDTAAGEGVEFVVATAELDGIIDYSIIPANPVGQPG